jgi:hypothetical protein
MVPFSKIEGCWKSVFRMDKAFVKDFGEWKEAGRYTSLPLHDTQGG